MTVRIGELGLLTVPTRNYLIVVCGDLIEGRGSSVSRGVTLMKTTLLSAPLNRVRDNSRLTDWLEGRCDRVLKLLEHPALPFYVALDLDVPQPTGCTF